MGNVVRTISVDEAEWNALHKLHPGKVSELVRSWVACYLGKARGEASQIDMELTKQELDKRMIELQEVQQKVMDLQSNLDLAKKRVEDDRIKTLEAEKLRIEEEAKKKKCMLCEKEVKKPINWKGKKYQLCVYCLQSSILSPQLPDYEVSE